MCVCSKAAFRFISNWLGFKIWILCLELIVARLKRMLLSVKKIGYLALK